MSVKKEHISVIDFIESKTILNIKFGDSIDSVFEKMKSMRFEEIIQKDFYLVAFGNVEFSFDYKILTGIHIEKNKPNARQLITFDPVCFDDLLIMLQRKKISIYSLEEDYINIHENKTSFFFMDGDLHEIYMRFTSRHTTEI